TKINIFSNRLLDFFGEKSKFFPFRVKSRLTPPLDLWDPLHTTQENLDNSDLSAVVSGRISKIATF
uniref:Uncharacterized protein n=1 Tax=Romanomermis culicivorax TaxID=13658 RepID=A0A915J7Y3_ROMCU